MVYINRIGGVMSRVLPSSVVDCGFGTRSGKTTEITIRGQICSPTRTHYPDSEHTSLCSFSLMLRILYRLWFYPIMVYINRIGGVMSRVLPSSVVDCGFGTRSGKTKDDIKFAALRRKSKDWYAQFVFLHYIFVGH
jgi:hypothetical protein